ncbi:MAG: carbonic anhydrase [Ignavibacteriales bacterium CG12_big_fil_rev_8_21_14_0_65_30_8]|nr:MAG: carbonic anhydrase [Ignavibacteriales bacterium CG12_big_fil_rev_8_21_14_0_65_30_8]
MKILFDGVKEFSKKEFEKNKNLFKKLSETQDPHTLFIGCSDSRVVPDLITKSLPGDLFVVRNIANVVPIYQKTSGYLSTTSAIEYAVNVLNIENIVVCGHSNCGGCRALFFNEKELKNIPHTKKWIELIKNSKIKAENIVNKFKDKKDIEWMIEQENIIEQMNHLLTYPFIKEKFKKGRINIYGWYYHIGSGSVFNYNLESKKFEKIK